MKEIVKKKLTKWLDVGIVYSIFDREWVSPTYYVSKKEGVIVVSNEKNYSNDKNVEEYTIVDK